MNNKVLKNASWIIGCKVVQAILSFVIGIFTARYLGPSNYGLISYAASIAAFFIPIMRLGFTSTLVQEFITKPDQEGKILGTSLTLSLISSGFCIIGILSFSMIANPNEPETILVCGLYSLTLIFQTFEMFQYWFQSKLLSKYPSIAALIAYLIISGYKLFLLISEKNVRWFALSHVLEMLVIGALLFLFFCRHTSQRLSFSFALGKKLLSRSYHYIPSALMLVALQQTDRIMLKLMISDAEAGFYSASIACIGISAFLFTAILDSGRPVVLESHTQSVSLFQKRTSQLFALVIGVSLLQCIGMALLAHPVIPWVYGEPYARTADILRLSVWYVPFAYIGMVRDIWILAEQKQRYLWMINLCGLLVNVGLNFFFIPRIGGLGAGLSSLLTQSFANFGLCFLIKPLRPCGVLILKALHPKCLLSLLPHRK